MNDVERVYQHHYVVKHGSIYVQHINRNVINQIYFSFLINSQVYNKMNELDDFKHTVFLITFLFLSHSGNESINDEIIKDLHRQFPDHFMFSGTNNKGQQDLFTVLKNFSIIKPEIAYCQGEAPIASVLLMHLPVEDAFFALVQLCDHYLSGYFTPGLETIQMHGKMLTSLLKRHNNYVYKVLKKQRIDSTMYMTEWFMCVFARTLPWPTVLRVWDMFFCEGKQFSRQTLIENQNVFFFN